MAMNTLRNDKITMVEMLCYIQEVEAIRSFIYCRLAVLLPCPMYPDKPFTFRDSWGGSRDAISVQRRQHDANHTNR